MRPADDLPSLTFSEEVGHKIATVTRGDTTRTFSYGGGAERVSDGRFRYEFDARGRLISATEELPAGRRILYDYSAHGRVVGRRAEYRTSIDGNWKLEDRAAVLAADALPADTTFVWDPISDRLAAIVGTDGSLIRAYVHGGSAYDDPLEVTRTDGTRVYPVFDEAATGNLQVILDANGKVLSRTVTEGAYGEDEFTLTGAAVDRIALEAKKDAAGAVESITITLRTTESLDPATVPTGARLAVVDESGAVLRSASATPTLIDNDQATLRWTLTGPEWTALVTGGGHSLSIAVTNTLRAAAWSPGLPILPSTAHTSPTHPAEHREPLTSLATWLTTIPPATTRTTAVFTMAGWGAVAKGPTHALGTGAFQALPFSEPATRLMYVRSRWYDPGAGIFLSPDPRGYGDSSNLYSFAAVDPISGRDPTGELCQRANASGFFDWMKRCGKDVMFVQQEFNRGVVSWKTPARAVAGLVGTANMMRKTVVGVAEISIDTMLMQLGSEEAARRQGQRIGAVIHAALNPIDTIVHAHAQAADKILEHEQRGEWFRGSIEAGEIGAADAAAAGGALQGGVSLARAGSRALAGATSFVDDFRFNISPLSDTQMSQFIPLRAFKPHGNSLAASGPHDVYAILDRQTRQVYHFGETGRGWQVRGAEWVRKLRKEHGLDTIAELLRQGTGKGWAKVLETRYIDTYTKWFGRPPHYFDARGNVVIIQKTRH